MIYYKQEFNPFFILIEVKMRKNINVNELQSNISGILKEVQDGTIYEVMRYSDPIAVVLSYEEFLKLRGECKRCVEDLRKLVKEESK
jgi:prevent-host-death family protein